jgi:O-antigen/teichoic acid export membrane protein
MTTSPRARLRAVLADPRLGRILRDAGLTTSAAAVSAVLGIARNGLLARALGLEGYGSLAVIVSSAALVRQILSVRAWEWATVELSKCVTSRDAGRAGAVLRATWAIGAAVGGLASLVVVALGGVLAERVLEAPALAGTLRLYSLALLASVLDEGSLAALRVSGRHRFVSLYTIGASTLRLAVLVPATVFGGGLRAVVLAIIAGQLLPGLWGALAARRALTETVGDTSGGSVRAILREWRAHAKTVATMSATDTIKTLTGEVDPLLIASLRDAAAVAPYRAAYNVVYGVLQLATPLYMVFYPEMTKAAAAGDAAAVARLVRQITWLGGLVAAGAVTTLVLFAPLVTRLLYGPGFERAATDMRLMAPWALVLAVQWANPLFVSAGRPKWTTLMVGAGLVAKVGAMALLIPRFADMGAAAAWMFYALAVVVTALAQKRRALDALPRKEPA